MVIERDYASGDELGFAQNPNKLAEKSYVNMYLHHDGYPEWQGVQICNWLKANATINDGTRLSAKLVRDMWYDSCYLYTSPDDIDHQYTYVIWVGDNEDYWISCYDQYSSKCVFVNKPDQIIKRYKSDMEYTDWAKETRYTQEEKYTN
jgi:hypothetical protein